MTRRRREVRTGTAGAIAFNAALLVVALTFLVATSRLRTSAAVAPWIVGVPLALLLLYRLVREVMAARSDDGVEAAPARTHDERAAILWLLALPAAATVLGFVAGPAVWVFAWARYRAGERLLHAAGAGGIAAVAILALFAGLLGARLPTGLLGTLVR